MTPGLALSPEECDQLRALVPTLRISPSAGRPGHYDLQPESQVGAVRLEGLALEIRPKIPIERVLFLVSYALDPKAWSKEEFGFGVADSLVEAIVPGFVHQLSRALRRGLLYGYQLSEEALPTVRGRIRIQDQVARRFGLTPPVEVRYDEFTDDIEENRILRAAVECLGRLPFRSDSRRGLRRFEVALSAVSRQIYNPQRLPDIHYSRLNEHYRWAVELAKLILRGVSSELRHGPATSSAFLVDMNDVFERFVLVALREALGLSEEAFPRGASGRTLYLDADDNLPLAPDLSWWEGSRCVFVGDVKYKKLGQREKHPDLYQLLAYLTATHLGEGLLIYAAGEEEPRSHHIARAGKTLHITTLDVSGEPSAILQQVERLARLVRELRSCAQGVPGSALRLGVSSTHRASHAVPPPQCRF